MTEGLKTKRSWIAALYQWTTFGVGTVGLVMGILGLCLNAANYLILKGISVPMPIVGLVFFVGVGICIAIGWAWEHYKFWEAVNTRANKIQNKEFIDLCKDVADIKKYIEEKK